MRTFTFTLFAVLSYVAVISATPLQSRADPQCADSDTTCQLCTTAENYGAEICSGFCNTYTYLDTCLVCRADDSGLGICKDFCDENPESCGV